MAESLEAGLDQFYAAQTAAAEGDGTSSLVTFKPMVSNALKVHPDQVQEAADFAKKNGVPTEYRPDGRPVIVSSRQFRELAKIQGFRHQGY